jgi:hypothetical protein
MRYRKGWIVLVVMAILSPLGLLAIGSAWGEWDLDDIKEMIGFEPRGMREIKEKQPDTALPDYEIPGFGESGWKVGLSTIISALIGAGLTAGLTITIARLARYGRLS